MISLLKYMLYLGLTTPNEKAPANAGAFDVREA